MKVYAKCKKCENEIEYSTSANTRVEFAMYEGEIKKLDCKNCGTKAEFHVDELFAKASKMVQMGAGVIFLIGTPLMIFFLYPIFTESRNHYVIYIVGGCLLVPVTMYGMIKSQDRTRVNTFNRSYLKGRIHNR